MAFTCNYCSWTVLQSEVDEHLSGKCEGCSLACLNCRRDFDGCSYKHHVECITKDKNYRRANFKFKGLRVIAPKVGDGCDLKVGNLAPKVGGGKFVPPPKLPANNTPKSPITAREFRDRRLQLQDLKALRSKDEDSSMSTPYVPFVKKPEVYIEKDYKITTEDWMDLLRLVAKQKGDGRSKGAQEVLTYAASCDVVPRTETGFKFTIYSKKRDLSEFSQEAWTIIKKEKNELLKRKSKSFKDPNKEGTNDDSVSGEDEIAAAPRPKKKLSNGKKKLSNGKKTSIKERIHLRFDSEEMEEAEKTEEAEEGESKKKEGKRKQTNDEGAEISKKLKLNDTLEEAEESQTRPDKFPWQEVVVKVLEAKGGELSLKKLRRKVMSEYQTLGADKEVSPEKLEAKLTKALKKIPNVKVKHDIVTLDSEV